MALLKRILPMDRILHEYIAEGSYDCALPVLSLFITFGESHSRLLIDWATSSEVSLFYVIQVLPFYTHIYMIMHFVAYIYLLDVVRIEEL